MRLFAQLLVAAYRFSEGRTIVSRITMACVFEATDRPQGAHLNQYGEPPGESQTGKQVLGGSATMAAITRKHPSTPPQRVQTAPRLVHIIV